VAAESARDHRFRGCAVVGSTSCIGTLSSATLACAPAVIFGPFLCHLRSFFVCVLMRIRTSCIWRLCRVPPAFAGFVVLPAFGRFVVLNTRFVVLNTRFVVPSTRFVVPSTRFVALNTRFVVLNTHTHPCTHTHTHTFHTHTHTHRHL